MANNPASAVPSWSTIQPVSRDSLSLKTKQLSQLEIPGIFYNQYTPTAANCNTGTVTSNGASMVGAIQLGVVQSGTAPLGGLTIVTFSSSNGLLCTLSTAASWLPDTLNYNNMPVTFTTSSGGVLPTGIVSGQIYYWQWVSSTTGNIALTPGGSAIPYTNSGTATIYVNAATQYWGSPVIPAGFLQAVEGLGSINYNTSAYPGVQIHGEIGGSVTSAGTGNIQMTTGLMNYAGTFTAITTPTNIALAAVGPFPFWYTFDIIVQQYGQSTVNSPYTNIGLLKASSRMVVAQAATSGTADVTMTSVWTNTTSLDLTQQYVLDARCLLGTPATGTYVEPLYARFWAYN